MTPPSESCRMQNQMHGFQNMTNNRPWFNWPARVYKICTLKFEVRWLHGTYTWKLKGYECIYQKTPLQPWYNCYIEAVKQVKVCMGSAAAFKPLIKLRCKVQ